MSYHQRFETSVTCDSASPPNLIHVLPLVNQGSWDERYSCLKPNPNLTYPTLHHTFRRNARSYMYNNPVEGDMQKLMPGGKGVQRCLCMWLRITLCACQPLCVSIQPFTLPIHCPSSNGFGYLILNHVPPCVGCHLPIYSEQVYHVSQQ